MLVNIVIIIFSIALFIYWFRYTCLLLLSTKTPKNYARAVAADHELTYPRIQQELGEPLGVENMAALRQALEGDYKLLTSFLSKAGRVEDLFVEQQMLRIDYQVMKLQCHVSLRFAKASVARQAMEEMIAILDYMANSVGERSAVHCSSQG